MLEIYAYGNVDSLNGVFNAIAAIMGGDDYFGLIRTIAITGVLVAAFAGLFNPGRFHGWGWLFGFLFVYYAMFMPKADVAIIDKLGNQPPTVISNVPIGVAFFGHYTSKVGDVMTRFFETAFQTIPSTGAQLPAELTYQKNGVLFGNRLIQATRKANIADPQLRTDLINYIYNCTYFDLQDGTIDPAAFSQSPDIWSMMGTPNPGRFSTYGSPIQVDTCPAVFTHLNSRLPAEVANAKAILAFHMNPGLDPTAAQTAIDPQIEQAYYKSRIATGAQGAAELLRQNILINLIQDTTAVIAQKTNDPAAMMIATARANTTSSLNSSYLVMGKVAEQALPMIRNVIEAVIYAVFPFVFLLFLLAQERGLGLAIKSFALSLVWIQLWPPLYAVLNYVATLASATNLAAVAKVGSSTSALALETASSIYSGAVSDQAIAGYMVISIPIIATAIIKGGEVAFAAVTGAASIQSTASSEGSQTARGTVSQGMVSTDQYSVDATHKSPLMVKRTDAQGDEHTQMLGSGVRAISTLQNSTYLSGAIAATRSRELSQAAERASEAGRTEAIAAAAETVSVLAQTISKSREGARTTESGNTVTQSEMSTLEKTHQRLKSQALDLSRKYGISEEDAAAVFFSVAAGLGLDVGLRASKQATSAPGGTSINPGAGVDRNVGGSVSVQGGGTLQQQYRAQLARAYDEVSRHSTQEQTAEISDYAKRTVTDAQIRQGRSASERDADQISAQFGNAMKHASSAQAHFVRRQALSEQARLVRGDTTNIAYDWTRDPRNSAEVGYLLSQLRDVQNDEQQRAVISRALADRHLLATPTRYPSGITVNWSDHALQETYRADSSDLIDRTRETHSENRESVGPLQVTPMKHRRWTGEALQSLHTTSNEIERSGKRLSAAEVDAQSRFDHESGLGDQNRDGTFGSTQSTATRAFNNSVEDGKRSVRTFSNALEDATFGTIFKWLNKDQNR